jgi:hypothetical protein
MTTLESPLRVRRPGVPLLRWEADVSTFSDATVRRRIGLIWGLLYLNVLPYYERSSLLHMPVTVGKLVTQGALFVAVIVAMSINRKVLLRPNLFLLLMSVLCVTSFLMSARLYFGYGSIERACRLVLFVAVLWLLTPWWGRRDLLLLRFHRRALGVVLAVVVLGAMILPRTAFSTAGRLGGAVWPIPPTQVAHYAAILTGTTVVLWFTGLIKAQHAAIVSVAGLVLLLLTHTRTALVALLVGVLIAALSLFMSRKRVRMAFAVTAVLVGLIALSFAPFLTTWFTRGESHKELLSFTGRQSVWTAVAEQPRSELNTVFGYGMSNDSFNGLSIDSSWYATYLDQGLFGDVVNASVLALLLLVALFSPRGPRRAMALFLVVYCALASITETGLGEASPYLLDLAVTAALLMPPLVDRTATQPALPARTD